MNTNNNNNCDHSGSKIRDSIFERTKVIGCYGCKAVFLARDEDLNDISKWVRMNGIFDPWME